MENIFGVAEQSLKLTEDRASLLTNNLVNSSTPNYKAKDIDFFKVLKGMSTANSGSLTTSHPNHVSTSQGITSETTKYRIPMQVSMDGNTVDPEIERKNFLQNSLRYQVSLTFIQNRTDQLSKAIKGE